MGVKRHPTSGVADPANQSRGCGHQWGHLMMAELRSGGGRRAVDRSASAFAIRRDEGREGAGDFKKRPRAAPGSLGGPTNRCTADNSQWYLCSEIGPFCSDNIFTILSSFGLEKTLIRCFDFLLLINLSLSLSLLILPVFLISI